MSLYLFQLQRSSVQLTNGAIGQNLYQVPRLDKAPRLSTSIVIWILSSDTICQLNQFNTNSEAAMLSIIYQQKLVLDDFDSRDVRCQNV